MLTLFTSLHNNSYQNLITSSCKRSIHIMSMKNQHQQQQQDQEQHQEVMNQHKNPNLETTNNHHRVPPPPSPSSSSQDFNTTHEQHMMSTHASNKTHDEGEVFTFKNANDVIKNPNFLTSSSQDAKEGQNTSPPPPVYQQPEVAVAVEEESGRDRLKRHRVEMAGRVRIPDIWGHEDLLKDWIDCTVFDSSLGNNNIMSARAALIQERRSTLRIENQC